MKTEKDNVVEFVAPNEDSRENPETESLEQSSVLPPESGERSAEEEVELDELELLRQEKDNYYDLLLRKQAEFENYRRRVTREKQESINLARISLLQDILPIVDACEKGVETLRQEEDNPLLETYRAGYELLLRNLMSFLEKNSVSVVPGVGSVFDPNIHEAVLREVSKEHEDGEILEEFRRGYTMNDQLIRAAQVKVAVHPD